MQTSRLLEFVDRIVASDDLLREAKQALEGAETASAFCALAKRSGIDLEREAVESALGSELASSMSCMASAGSASSSVLTMLQMLDLGAPPPWLRLPSMQFDTGSLCW
jgi:hypothetical protein